MSPFERLTPALQYQIVNTLGWTELRPVQLLTIDAVLDGRNCVVLAPTAGGKTEAAFFPALSAMDAGDWRPVSLLYLSPIRALLNNQETRVAHLAGLLGRRAFKWHGDVTQSQRKAFLDDPTDILLTTPESLEAMMMSSRVPARQLFAGLKTVIVDEVHAFADDDRGAHLSAVLERLSRFCGRDVQRIGLSATVGNPEDILRWIQGSSKRAGVVISPPRPTVEPDIKLDYVATAANAALVIKRLHPGKKRLVFVDSRRGVEELGKYLIDNQVTTFVTHGSLSVTARRDAERAFQEGSDCVIAATSVLELGIDVGNLDRVLQLDSPPSIASFLQRMGRTGRRPGQVPNCTFLTTKDETTLQAAAIIALNRAGYVEPVQPRTEASHILAHQIMALGIQLDGVGSGDFWAWVAGASAFARLTPEDRAALVAHMLDETILADHDGKLWLGERGEKLYARRNFSELYAVFSTPRLVTVRWNTKDVGTVDALFLQGLDAGEDAGTFTLGGRAWQIETVDWPRGICVVRPAAHARNTRWSGAPRYLSYDLCQQMRAILIGEDQDPAWSPRATEVITTMRAEHEFLRENDSPILKVGEEITWWTFAGGRANLLLAQLIEREIGGKVTVRNTSVTCKKAAGESLVRLRQLIESLHGQDRPNRADALLHAQGAARARVSKFEPCLPEPLLLRLLSESVLDLDGARAAVANVVE